MTLDNTGLSCIGPLIHEFFSVSTCTVFDPWLGVTDAEGRLNALIYALYGGLEHPWICVSAGVLEPIPHEYQGTTKFWESQKLDADFFYCARVGGAPDPPH